MTMPIHTVYFCIILLSMSINEMKRTFSEMKQCYEMQKFYVAVF